MSRRPTHPSWIASATFLPGTIVPAGVATRALPDAPVDGAEFAELAVLALVIYVVYVAITVVLGALVLVVSEVLRADSYVGAIERRIYDRPIRSGALGFVAILGGGVGLFVLTVVLLVFASFGAPEAIALLVVPLFFGGMLFLYVAATVGTIVLGSYLLRRFGSGEPNPWLALVVGALVVNAPPFNLVLALPLLFLGTGAMVDRWWGGRRDGSSGRNASRRAEG